MNGIHYLNVSASVTYGDYVLCYGDDGDGRLPVQGAVALSVYL
jgi:hypothetical protein